MKKSFQRAILSPTFAFLLLMFFIITLLIGAAANVFSFMGFGTFGMLLAFYALRGVSRADFLREAGLE